MSGRAKRLDRLLAIRRLSADLDRRSVKLALAAVSEVEAGLERQAAALVESRLAGRQALSLGNRGEWLLADVQGEVAGWNQGRLRPLMELRTSEASQAMQQLLESRREHEKVKQVIEDARRVERLDQDRKAQAEADDWFLSRRARPAV